MRDPPTQFKQQTWTELVKLVKARLAQNSQKNILYGDLAEAIFGKRHGGQAFSGSLHEIYVRTKDYNKRNESRHPLLNALVFKQRGEQPSIPEHQDPAEIWWILRANGSRYLDRLGILLGYNSFSDGKAVPTKQKQLKDDVGPTGRGKRSEAVWEARQSPLVKEIADILDELDWTRCAGEPWRPDIVRKQKSKENTIVIEVKPTNSTHDIITAIGQIVCYRTPFKRAIGVIAAPGASKVSCSLRSVLDEIKIQLVDLDDNPKTQLKKILSHPGHRSDR